MRPEALLHRPGKPWLRAGAVLRGESWQTLPSLTGGVIRLFNPDDESDYADVDPRLVDEVQDGA